MKVYTYNERFFNELENVDDNVVESRLVPFGTLSVGTKFILPNTKTKKYRGNTHSIDIRTTEPIETVTTVSSVYGAINTAIKYKYETKTKFQPYIYVKISPRKRPNYGFEYNAKIDRHSYNREYLSGFISDDTLVLPLDKRE
jgi:hypothetical protein